MPRSSIIITLYIFVAIVGALLGAVAAERYSREGKPIHDYPIVEFGSVVPTPAPTRKQIPSPSNVPFVPQNPRPTIWVTESPLPSVEVTATTPQPHITSTPTITPSTDVLPSVSPQPTETQEPVVNPTEEDGDENGSD